MLVPRLSRYVDRPQPAARERADVPRREQHRARADALLHRRPALPRRPRARRRARSRAGASTYWRPYHDALARRARAPRRARTATRSSGTGTASRRSCRGCSKGELPDLNLGTAGGASCAPALRAALMAVLAAQIELQPRHRRPLQGRLHHAPLRPARASACTRSSSRWAGDATWTRRAPRFPSRRPIRGRSPACGRCCARCCRRRSTGAPMPAEAIARACSGRRSPGCPAAGASTSCCAPAPTAAGPR